jgi:hypothetical protein
VDVVMKYLTGTETQSNVAILWIVARYLSFNGKTAYEQLSATLRPPSLVSSSEGALVATLSVGRHLDILTSTGSTSTEMWELGPLLADDDNAWFHDRLVFRALVRDAMLQRAVRDIAAGEEAADIPLGLAWLLSRDPMDPLSLVWGDGTETAVKEADLLDVLSGSTPWNAFRRWARALGLVVTVTRGGTGKQALVPDPTAAIEECLRDMPVEQAARDFVDSLAALLPVIDSGAVATALQKRGVAYTARGDATLGPAVAYGLLRLERRGRLRLEQAHDTAYRVSYRLQGRHHVFDTVIIPEAESA